MGIELLLFLYRQKRFSKNSIIQSGPSQHTQLFNGRFNLKSDLLNLINTPADYGNKGLFTYLIKDILYI